MRNEIIDDEFINKLINCEKRITEFPSNFQIQSNRRQKVFRLESTDMAYCFKAFYKINETFEENFSVGLIYTPRDSSNILLVRFNGPHGPVYNKDGNNPYHSTYHSHRTTAYTLLEGLKDGSVVEENQQYSTHQEALGYFVKYVNIINAKEHIKFPSEQLEFDFDEE